MMRMAVKGIGVTGGFGCGVDDLRRALADGRSPLETISVSTAGGPVELPAFRAATDRLEEFVAKRTLRRIDNFSRMGLLGAYQALADAGMLESDHSRMGVIVASGYGATSTTFAFLDSLINDGDICASPTHFANSVHNAAAANISIQLGATGPSLTVSQFDMSVPSALLTARQWLAEGRVDSVLFGAIDELSELIAYIWLRQRGSGGNSPPNPLNTGEDTAVLGEGAAFFLLTRAEEETDGYCAIDGVTTGCLWSSAPPLIPERLTLLGADGRGEFGSRYRDVVSPGAACSCYTPLYGSFPAGQAFDLAVAALILKEGQIFASPGSSAADISGTVAPIGEFQQPGRVACLTLAGDDDYGLVTLDRL